MFSALRIRKEIAERKKVLVVVFAMVATYQSDNLPDDGTCMVCVVKNEGEDARDTADDVCEEEEQTEEDIEYGIKLRRYFWCRVERL